MKWQTPRGTALELPKAFCSFDYAPNRGVSSGQRTLSLLWLRLVPGDHGGHAGERGKAHRNGVFAVRNATVAEPQTDVRVERSILCKTNYLNSRFAVAKNVLTPLRNLLHVAHGSAIHLQYEMQFRRGPDGFRRMPPRIIVDANRGQGRAALIEDFHPALVQSMPVFPRRNAAK